MCQIFQPVGFSCRNNIEKRRFFLTCTRYSWLRHYYVWAGYSSVADGGVECCGLPVESPFFHCTHSRYTRVDKTTWKFPSAVLIRDVTNGTDLGSPEAPNSVMHLTNDWRFLLPYRPETTNQKTTQWRPGLNPQRLCAKFLSTCR